MSYPRALTRAVLCMLLSLTLLACEEGGKGAPGSSGPREVVIIKLEPRREVYTTALAGRIASFQVAEVRPQVGGILQQRLFTEGADVKTGQALYQIDPATYEAALDSAQAALMKAEANVTPARLKAERFRELLAIKAVSKQEYDDAQAAFKQAEADVAVNRAAVKTARINLEYTKVRSPISGRIGKSAFTPGALVTANQAQALTSVRQLDPVYVDITQSSQDLLRLRAQFTNGELRSAAEEAPVRLKLENGAMYPHEGRLQFTDVSVDESTGMVSLRALFPNPEHILLPGMYVRAVIAEGVDENALLVPQRALRRDPKGQASVLLVDGGGKVDVRLVDVGRTVGDSWQVLSGLKPGDRVIVEGGQNVRPGMSVKIRGEG
ncbi:efflux transporter, RND family, MFP subunit [Bilophila wadsworthia 3_1_6]|uniref:Efflux transporter, RND family, MFP subunit n=1 Tax=Bilophila wadsworthia (strain 3_1_6) TaxID=563192 RepID=E5YB36_BILW3|nr:efflux RND transporter periplasmic adaptor subunit [Bilophila wadsworthia]EFV42732.2 efflux transporter, RND family, MFP subunit [Bilophila wadsworthia 3_1_6]